MKKNRKLLLNLVRVLIYIFLIILLILSLVPFIIMIINSTRSNSEILRGVSMLPSEYLIDNYEILINYVDVWRGFINSLVIALSVTLLSSYFSALSAYAFEFFKFKGKWFILLLLLILMMVPGQLSLLGQYELNNYLGILDTYWALIIPAIAAPFTILFFKQYLQTSLHPALIEAARIDGGSEIYIFHKIVLPILMPAISTQGIFTFIGSWNNYLQPLTMLRTPSKFTLPVMMGALNGSPVAMNLGAMYVGIAISVVPMMIIFILFSRNIIGSISAGSIK